MRQQLGRAWCSFGWLASVLVGAGQVEAAGVVVWGSSRDGTNAPPETANAVALVAGGSQGGQLNLALLSDGTVVAWGLNDYGQTNTPPGLAKVVAIAAGYRHNLALCSDGKVVASGANDYGQTNAPPDLTNVVAISADWGESLALCSDKTVVAWGGYWPNGITNIPPNLTNLGEFILSGLEGGTWRQLRRCDENKT